MTFSRSNPLGWAFGETLTSAQMNTVDINTARAVDGFAGGTYNPSALLTWNAKMEIDASAGPGTNVEGIEVTGKGSGDGILVNSGGASSVGVNATGGANTEGLLGTGGSGNGIGVIGRGTGTSTGVYGQGGETDGIGVTGDIHPSATNAIGVQGTGKGTEAGVKGIAVDGPGAYGTVTGGGYGVVAEGAPDPTVPAGGGRASLRVVPQSAEPLVLQDGSVWVRSDTDLLHVNLNSLVHTVITNRAIQAPKVLGLIDAGNSFGSPVVRAGDLNIASAAYTASILRVTFTTALTGTDYFVLVNHDSSIPYHMQAINHTTTTVDIRRFDTTGAQVSFNIAQDIVVHLAIFSLGGI
jgi:hypothetical protein